MLIVKDAVFKEGKTITMAINTSVIAERSKIKHGASKQFGCKLFSLEHFGREVKIESSSS